MGISTPWICLPASLSKTRYCASLHPTRNATQWLPKWLLNSLSLPNRMNCELLPRKARIESGNSSPVSPGHWSKMAARRLWSFFCRRNELDTWAIAFLAKSSSTPNRSDLIDGNRMLKGVADYVLFRLQQASNHLSRLAASVDLDVSNEVQTSLAQVKSILADTERNW